MTADSPMNLAEEVRLIESLLTPDEREAFLATAYERHPNLRGCPPADILDHIENYELYWDELEEVLTELGDVELPIYPYLLALALLFMLGKVPSAAEVCNFAKRSEQ